MSAPIFNRDFQHPADGFYMIEPDGNHPNCRADITQVIDSVAKESIANRFNQDAAAGRLSHGHEMLVDHEHFKHNKDKETIAYGWAQELQARSDGIYARIRWTATGKPAVDGGDYRFFSTEYDPGDLQVLNRSPKQVRPLRLDGLTLTNEPNNKGGRPITNRSNTSDASDTQARIAETASKSLIFQHVMEPVLNRGNKTPATRQAESNVHQVFAGKMTGLKAQQFLETLIQRYVSEGMTDEAARKQALAENPDKAALLVASSYLLQTAQVTNRSSDPDPQAPELKYFQNYSSDPLVAFQTAVAYIREIHQCGWREAVIAAAKVYPELWAAIPDADEVKTLLRHVVSSDKIANRAAEMARQKGGPTLAAAYFHAKRELDATPDEALVKKIQNRAAQLKREFPAMPAATLLIQAARELDS